VNKHFCFDCGTLLELRNFDQRPREVCPACGWIYYPQLKVGAGVVIEHDGKLLLLQRNHEPWKGAWNIPAGYVEADEDPRDAAQREVREETGLEVEIGELFKVYYYTDDPRGNGVALIYYATALSGTIRLDAESQAARYFAWHEIPTALAGGGHDQVILEWQQNSEHRANNP